MVKWFMRLLLTNPEGTQADVDNFFARVIEVGNRLLKHEKE